MSGRLSYRVLCALVAAALLAAAAPGLLFPGHVAQADVGELPEPGGLVTPGDKTDEIRMASESVLFSIRPNDGTFTQAGTQYYAHVTADFVMENLTSKAISKDLFFPLHLSYLVAYQDPALALMKQAENLKVMVEGQEEQVGYAELALSPQEKVVAAVFPVTFEAGKQTAIQVEYDVRAVNEPKSAAFSFKYMMQTGSHWAGTIGSGKVEFEFWQGLDSKSALCYANDFFRATGGRIEWNFTDLEPTPDHDITVTFEPTAIETWFTRPDYVKDIRAGAPAAQGIPDWDWLPGAEFPVGSWESSPAYLLDTGHAQWGWVIEQAKDSGVWLQIDLDRVHTLAGLLIRSGVLDEVWSQNGDRHTDVYDTFRRPKRVNVVLSDGTAQTVTLVDRPAEWQMIPLPNVPTTSIRLSFLDSYPGTGRGDAYLGVGRLQLVGVDTGSSDSLVGGCTDPNLLRNGDFEEGFDGRGVGLGWEAFHSEGGAVYKFLDDPWAPVVYEGLHSQLIGIGDNGTPPAADRYAGIRQTVAELEPGAEYELSLAGLLREEAPHPGEDPYRYRVQWALAAGQAAWTQVEAWQDLPWDTLYPTSEPGAFSTYTTRLLAPARSATLFMRAWIKWATPGRELDVNLDGIALRKCDPVAVVEPQPTWHAQPPRVSPSPRCCTGFVYDSARRLVVAVGGGTWAQISNETWEYDGASWTLRTDLLKPAPVRWTAAVAYNPDEQVTVLFGGKDQERFYNDTWQYDGQTWVHIEALTPPSPRNGAKMAYDGKHRRMVLFGGYYGPDNLFFDDTWEYEDGRWTRRYPVHRPPARESSALVYDAHRGAIVLFGGGQAAGSTVYGDTWEWDGNDWTERSDLPTSPPARWAHSMTYDEGRRRTILFGGLTGAYASFDDAWEYDGQIWVQVSAFPGPSARWDPGLTYDALNDRIVLFGGMEYDGQFGWLDDTWHYGAP